MDLDIAKENYDKAQIEASISKDNLFSLSVSLSDPKRSSMPDEYYDALYLFQEKRSIANNLYNIYIDLKNKSTKNLEVNKDDFFSNKTKERERLITSSTHKRWENRVNRQIDLLHKKR